jgi:hypothetical protein
MYNRLLLVGGLFLLTYLVTSLTFSQTTQPQPGAPVRPAPVLTAEEFKQTVTQMNAQTQSKLDMTLARLLGSSAPNAAPMQSTPAASTSGSSTPQPATTTTTPVYTAPASSGTGYNPYAN